MTRAEGHQELSPEDTARIQAESGDWHGVGETLGIKVFTSNPRNWTKSQKGLVALGLEVSAQGCSAEAAYGWEELESGSFLPAVSLFGPPLLDLEAWIKRRRAETIRKLDASTAVIDVEGRAIETRRLEE